MGADQSSGAGGQLRSQRDEDIPYTSFSIAKPIDGGGSCNQDETGSDGGDTPRSSPRISKTRGGSRQDQHTGFRASGIFEGVASVASSNDRTTSTPKHDIVVVAEGNKYPEDNDPELQKIENIPMFLPILRASLNLPNVSDPEVLERLDARQILLLAQRYQEHLKQCAEAVAFDQNALCVRVKEVDFVLGTLYSSLTDRQKKFGKYAEQIQKVQEMSTALNRIKMNVEQTVSIMERLNSVLPPEEQLEPFTMINK
eukprot:GHVU01093211.1.p1 GENE.GHVU01093211.1~~GHVU01093211.1.p1  ORF type:complete len:255 (+),score=30.04 GHVU01093211.1:62-826(+)